MNKKTRSTKSEKWRHTCNSVEIAWTNEQKVAVTSFGRNKNHDDEIKKTKRRPIIAPAIAVRLLNKIITKPQPTKTALKCRTWTKISLAYRIFYHTSISRSLENSDMSKKPLFAPLFILFSNKITPNFFTCFIYCFKIHSNKIDSKKDFSKTPLRVVKTQHPYTIPILWLVKNQEHRNIAPLRLQL